MALTVIEGLDRVGKTSVAQWFEKQGYEFVHMTAPPKGQTADLFLEEMMNLIASAAHRDIVLDRSYYGEACIWPKIYNREPLLNEEGLEALREIEESVGVTRILMLDPNSEAHWQRCVDNKEPLTKSQFIKARTLYSSMADQYGFVRKTLKDFPDAVQPLPAKVNSKLSGSDNLQSAGEQSVANSGAEKTIATTMAPANNSGNTLLSKTKEQLKLERANAINEVLAKRVLKGKGPIYDDLERNVRHFLNGELGKIFGSAPQAGSFSSEEVDLLKFFCKRLKDKET